MWLDLLGLTEYDDVIRSRGVTGQLLMDLQTKDILVRIAILHVPYLVFHVPYLHGHMSHASVPYHPHNPHTPVLQCHIPHVSYSHIPYPMFYTPIPHVTFAYIPYSHTTIPISRTWE